MSFNENDWTPMTKEFSPEGEVVEVMDSGGHVQRLKRKGNLFWFPDESMYVYYVPQFWKRIPDERAPTDRNQLKARIVDEVNSLKGQF